MSRTKLAINSYNKTEAPFRATQSIAAAQILPPRIGNENNLNRRIRDMRLKSKKLIPQLIPQLKLIKLNKENKL